MYPNPARDELHVRYPMLETNAEMYILDCMGKRLTVPYREEGSEVVFDVRSLPTGMYLLVLEGQDRIVRRLNVIR